MYNSCLNTISKSFQRQCSLQNTFWLNVRIPYGSALLLGLGDYIGIDPSYESSTKRNVVFRIPFGMP